MNAFSLFFEALHESRRRQAERELHRYRHLVTHAQQNDLQAGVEPAGQEDSSLWRDTNVAAAGAGV